MKKVEVQMVSSYAGHSVRANGVVQLDVKCSYGELSNAIQAIQMLNNDITTSYKFPEEKAAKVGPMRLDTLTVKSDGTSTIRLKGAIDYIDVDKINDLALSSSEEEFRLKLVAEIDTEDDEEDDEDWGE